MPLIHSGAASALLLAVSLSLSSPIPAQAQSASGAQKSGAQQASPNGNRVPGGPHWDWWNDASVQRELNLDRAKVSRIDAIYRRRSADLAPIVEDYFAELAKLDTMTKAATVDESTYNLQVLRVEALRSKISESRTMMLYRFFRELQPEQYKKLQEIFARMARQMRDRGAPAGR